jgi:hypothetical protein
MKLSTINKCVIFDAKYQYNYVYSPLSITEHIAGHKQGKAVEIPLVFIPE